MIASAVYLSIHLSISFTCMHASINPFITNASIHAQIQKMCQSTRWCLKRN